MTYIIRHNQNIENIIPIIISNIINIISIQKEQGAKGREIITNISTKIVMIKNAQIKNIVEIINNVAKLGYRIHQPNTQQAGAYNETQIR